MGTVVKTRVSERSGLGHNVEEEESVCGVSDLLYLAGNVASFRYHIK